MPIKTKLIHLLLAATSIFAGFTTVSFLDIGGGVRSFFENAKQVEVFGPAQFHVGVRGTSSYIAIGEGEGINVKRVACPYSYQKIPCGNPGAMRDLLRANPASIIYFEDPEPISGGLLGVVKSIKTPTAHLIEDPLQTDPSRGNRVFSVTLAFILSIILYVALILIFKSAGVLSK